MLAPEPVVGTKYPSRDAMMADPASGPVDGDNQLIATEAALRQCNRDQIDADKLMQAEVAQEKCNAWSRFRGRCQ